MIFWIFTITLIFTGLIYSALIIFSLRGWNRLPAYIPSAKNASGLKFSIIIPARNEENNIVNCVEDIINQQFDKSCFEIIVVDDFSEDLTFEKVNSFKKNHPEINLHIIQLEKMLPAGNHNSYKKLAIAEGIKTSKNEWIITTDADCRRGENWLASIAEYISGNPNVKLISAPVCLTYSHTFFQKAQALEFSGLIGIGAACIAQKMPTMCNGANLIYQKSAYKNVNGFAGNETLASGDDEFMMHKIAAEWQDDVHFLKSQESIVYTSALLGIKAFLQQRKRWASKGKHYKSTKLTLLLASVYIFYALTLASLFLGFFHWKYFIVLIFALLLKCLPEWIFLRRISVFFNRKELMNCYFVTVLLQIVYVVIIGIYGNFGKYNWKGREVK